MVPVPTSVGVGMPLLACPNGYDYAADERPDFRRRRDAFAGVGWGDRYKFVTTVPTSVGVGMPLLVERQTPVGLPRSLSRLP